MVFVALALSLGACQSKTVRPTGTDTERAPAAPVESVRPAESTLPSASAAPVAPPASASAAVADAGVAPPALAAPDGGVLPQTEQRPSSSSVWIQRSARLLFQAIALDKPQLAHPVFFPIEAYRRVKAVSDPDRDYDRRLVAHFDRDIHDYHQKLGKQASEAAFVALEIPEDRAKWMKPHSEGNKLGYFRVLRSKLRYRVGSGAERFFEVTSLISWRGEWYVVHLNGFE